MSKLEFDPLENLLRIKLGSSKTVDTVTMPDGAMVEIDKANRVVGILIYGPDDGWNPQAIIQQWNLDERTAKILFRAEDQYLINPETANTG